MLLTLHLFLTCKDWISRYLLNLKLLKWFLQNVVLRIKFHPKYRRLQRNTFLYFTHVNFHLPSRKFLSRYFQQCQLSKEIILFSPFKRQPHKMVKHTKTIRRQITNELFECVWPFCGVDTSRVKGIFEKKYSRINQVKFVVDNL